MRICSPHNLLILAVEFEHIIAEIMADAGIAPENESELGANSNRYRAMVNLRALHFLALFSLIYVGTEVTLGGT